MYFTFDLEYFYVLHTSCCCIPVNPLGSLLFVWTLGRRSPPPPKLGRGAMDEDGPAMPLMLDDKLWKDLDLIPIGLFSSTFGATVAVVVVDAVVVALRPAPADVALLTVVNFCNPLIYRGRERERAIRL